MFSFCLFGWLPLRKGVGYIFAIFLFSRQIPRTDYIFLLHLGRKDGNGIVGDRYLFFVATFTYGKGTEGEWRRDGEMIAHG